METLLQIDFSEDEKQRIINKIKEVVNKQYPNSNIVCLYLWGSRLFGSADQESDLDFIAVLDTLHIPNLLQPETVVEIDDEKEHIDVAIYDNNYWKYCLQSHSAILLPFRFPLPKAIWISSKEPPLELPLRILKLKAKILNDLATEMSEAKTCFKQGRLRKAKKRIINSIRNIRFGIQVVKNNGKVVDYGECNELSVFVMKQEFKNFDEFEKFKAPLVKKYIDEFLEIADYYRVLEAQTKAPPLNLASVECAKNFGLEKLDFHFSVIHNKHPRFPELLYLTRIKDEAPTHESKIARECNGIIVNTKEDLKVICYALDWFPMFAHEERLNVDWKTVKVFEKLDGQQITMFYYEKEWIICSKQTPDASEIFIDSETQKSEKLSDIFWDIWKSKNYSFPSNKDFCYVFQMLRYYKTKSQMKKSSNRCRSTVYNQSERIVLIAIRNILTLQEIQPSTSNLCENWEIVKELKQLENKDGQFLMKLCDTLNPLENHGFVVCDKDFNRLSFRTTMYDELLDASNQLNPIEKRRILRDIAFHEYGSENLLEKFPYPKDKAVFESVLKRYHQLCQHIMDTYNSIKDIQDNVTFAQKAKAIGESQNIDPFFYQMIRKGKMKTIPEILAKSYRKQKTYLFITSWWKTNDK